MVRAALLLLMLGVAGVAAYSWFSLAPELPHVDLPPAFTAVGERTGEFGLPLRIRHEPTGIVLILVPSGRSSIGAPLDESGRDGDEVLRDATIPAPFYLGETEVTVGQWRAVLATEPPLEQTDDSEPTCGVTWYAAQEFVARLNANDPGWRLPTEDEWEVACRAGTTTPFSFGETITPDQVNYNGRYPYREGERGLDRGGPVPVGSFPPNGWGFYDMHGNVWEWCEDLYVAHPERGERAADEPGAPRVMRGGAFTTHAKRARSAYRDGYPPNSSGAKYGMRVAYSIPK